MGRPLPSLQKLKLTVWLIWVQGANNTLAGFICGSWWGTTKTQYACAWRNWAEWCRRFSIPRTTPIVGQFLKYLWFLYEERHMAWSTIRVHRADIATIIDPLTNSPLSQQQCSWQGHRLGRWNLSGASLLYWGCWDPGEARRNFPDKSWLGGWQYCDLSLLHIDEDHLFKTNDSWHFHLVFGAKQDRPGHIPQDVIISSLPRGMSSRKSQTISKKHRGRERERATCSSFTLLFNLWNRHLSRQYVHGCRRYWTSGPRMI